MIVAVIDDGQPLAERVGLFHVVRGQQDGFAELVVFANDLPEQDAGLRIESGAGLVEKQDLRIVHHGARDGEALHHAAGKSAHHLIGAIGELEFFEQCVGALVAFFGGDAEVGAVEDAESRARSERNRDSGAAARRRSGA